MLIQALFYLFATILVLAALGVITSRNPVYSALALTLRHRAGYKQQNISAQVAVRRADRLRVVKMDPEPRA